MLTRRGALLAPLLLAGCGGKERRSFPPLRYDYLLPLPLNVATIRIEQRFVPSGVPPDVTRYDPVSPAQALRAMAEDRLQALGSEGEAVFVILDASLTRRGDTVLGNFVVELDIRTVPTAPSGRAEARVSGRYTGDLDELAGPLYDLTKDMMDRLNIEFEYQIRRSLDRWLLPAGAKQVPVQQQPLNVTPAMPPP